MDGLLKLVQSQYIYVPVALWFGIQLFKLLYDLVTTKQFNFKRIMGSGGMPSSHSAVVVGLATLIGKNEGVDTPIFALSFLFAFIVMYDACGVRRAAGKQAAVLNKIISTPHMSGVEISGKLGELIGHTPVQVLVGATIGLLGGLLA